MTILKGSSCAANSIRVYAAELAAILREIVSPSHGKRRDAATLARLEERLLMSASPMASGLLLSTDADINAAEVPELTSWDEGDVVSLGDPGLSLGLGSGGGTLSTVFRLDDFVTNGDGNIDGLHIVETNISQGGVTFEPGDILFSLDTDATLAGTDYDKDDILLFEPTVAGNYGAGTFSLLVDSSDLGASHIRGLTLVEQTISMPSGSLSPGDILFVRSGGAEDNDIYLIESPEFGSPSDGLVTKFLEGTTVGIQDKLDGIALIQSTMELGDETLQAGNFLLSLRDDDKTVGSGSTVNVFADDIFVLDLSGPAAMVLQGSDLGITSLNDFDAIALVRPVLGTPDTYEMDRDSTLNTTWNGWDARQQLTFDNTAQSEDLTDFTVLVELDASNIDYSRTLDDGSDLRFEDPDGTVLDHEIEVWDETGTSFVWVKVPQIDGGSGTDHIWMYYGNAAATPAPATSAWDSGYRSVHHLNESARDPTGDDHLDSTGNGNNLEAEMADSQLNVSGRIGLGNSFNGSSDYLEVIGDEYIVTQFAGTTELWINADNPNAKESIFQTEDHRDRALWIEGGEFHAAMMDGTFSWRSVSGGTVTNGWHHVVFNWDINAGELNLYVDGQLIDSNVGSPWASSGFFGDPASYGKRESTLSWDERDFFRGNMDEIRVSEVVRSADWVAAQHLSMTDNFVTFSGAEDLGVLNNDVGTGQLTAVLDTPPTNANDFSFFSTGVFEYTPNAGFFGQDTFTYLVTDGASTSDPVTVTINVSPNLPPTLTTVTNPVKTVAEDTQVAVSFTELLAASDAADPDGTVDGFVVTAVHSGTLLIGPSAPSATPWAVGTNDTIYHPREAWWLPDPDATGILDAFSVVALDDLGRTSATDQTVQIDVTPENDAPTLTSFSSTVASTIIDTEIEVAFSELATTGDEQDVDGYVDGFVVTSVTSGTLRIGTTTATATPWSASTNDTIAAGTSAYWTPDNGVTGTQNAFAVVAIDDGGLASTPDITAQIDVAATNQSPTLTTFASPVDVTMEDTEAEITFAELADQGDEADPDGMVTSFVVRSVHNGTLRIGATSETATDWAAGTNDVIDASSNAYWTPTPDASGTGPAMELVARDNFDAESSSPVMARMVVTAVNDPPTFTALSDSVGSTNEDTEVEVSWADIWAVSNEDDIDGFVIAGVITSVQNGTLRIGFDSASAQPWAPNTNDTFTVASELFWTPAQDLNGLLSAFSIVARDDGGLESSPPVDAYIDVVPVNDAPTLPALSSPAESTSENVEVELTFSELATVADENDVDGTVDKFVVDSVQSGSLRIGGDALNATGWSSGGNDTIEAGMNAYWTPDTNVNGLQNAFTFSAEDNEGLRSASPVQAQIDVAAVNTPPTLTTFSLPFKSTPEDTETEITFSELIADGNENDPDGTVTSFVVKVLGNGSLNIGATAGTATPWVAGTNDVIDASNNAYWTPSPDSTGTFDTFGVVARDDAGAESGANIMVQVDVTPVNDPPVLTSIFGPVGNTVENTEVEIGFSDIATVADEYDVDGTVEAFVIKAVNGGTLRIGVDSASATAWAAGTNDVVATGLNAFWTPDAGLTGSQNSFSVVARDNNGLESSPAIDATVTVAGAPVGAVTDSDASDNEVLEDATVGDSVGITAVATDPSGDTVTYSLDDDAGGLFAIAPTTGVVTVAGALDYEDVATHNIVVRATSTDLSSTTQGFTIQVRDVAATFTATGATTSSVGGVYELTVNVTDPGMNSVSGWTVVWGDGTTNRYSAAQLGTVTHTYTRDGEFDILVSVTDSTGTIHNSTIVVPGRYADTVNFYDQDGVLLHTDAVNRVMPADPDPAPELVILGPDGLLYVTMMGDGTVRRFNPSGTEVDILLDLHDEPGLLDGATGMAFDSDGYLYVGSFYENSIYKVDTTTGDRTAFVVGDSTNGLTGPGGVLFGPDGNLYVTSWLGSPDGAGGFDGFAVHRFDGRTGDYIDDFVTGGDNGLRNPAYMSFGEDGSLFVSSQRDSNSGYKGLFKFDANGQFEWRVQHPNHPHTFDYHPRGVSIGPDGMVYVTYAHLTGDQTEYHIVDPRNGDPGVPDEILLSALGPTEFPGSLFFTPEIQVNVPNTAPVAVEEHYFVELDTTLTIDAANGLLANDSDPDGDTLDARVTLDPADGALELFPAGLKQRINLSSDDLSEDIHVAWSPDGTKLAFVSDSSGAQEIWIMDADGTGMFKATSVNGTDVGLPDWSPDGSQLVFHSDHGGNFGIYTVSASGGPATPVQSDGDSHSRPNYSADGSRILFTTDRDGNSEIYSMATNGTDLRNLTNNPGADDRFPTSSPDGSIIAFTSNRDGNWEIYTMTADGNEQTRLTTGAGNDRAPVFSPDGTQILFHSNVDGDNEIFVMNVDGSNLQQLTSNDVDDKIPSFSPDGTQISYDTVIDGSYEVVVASIVSDGSFSYAPDAGFTGTDTFTYVAHDNNEDSNTVTVTLFVNNAISDSDTAANEVSELATIGATVGLTALANDPDVGDTVSYSLDDDAGGLFAIDNLTGVVTVAGALDYGTSTSHDVTVRVTSTDTSSTTQTFTVQVTNSNVAPTLTNISDPLDITPEDTEDDITFAELVAAANENDVDGTVDAFVIKALNSGTLLIGSNRATATPWTAGSNDVVDAATTAWWTPDADANGSLNAFSVVARDNDGLESSTAVDAQIQVNPVNDAPTLTSLSPSVTTPEDVEVEVTFANLTATGDENDIDGTVDAFVIKAVNTGTLRIGTSTATATAWSAGTNDTVDATNNAYWTPDPDVNGSQDAFAVVAQDDGGLESSTNVDVQIDVTPVNDAPTLASITTADTTPEDTEVEVTFAELATAGDENDIDGSVDAFIIKAVNTGTLRIGTSTATATAWSAGTNDTVDATNNAYWTPDPDANGTQSAFAVVAEDDGGLESSTNVDVQIDATPVNDAPTLTVLSTPVDMTAEDTELQVTFAELAMAGDENDIDGSVDAFVIKAVNSGTLRIGNSFATATAWVAGTNDVIDAANAAWWTPDLNANGIQNAFAVVARDNGGLESASNLDAQINVITGNDPPTLTAIATPLGTTAEDTEVQITFGELASAGNENDIDGTVDAFVIKAVNSGTLRIGTSAATATPWAAVTNDVIDGTNNAYWTPDADVNGSQNAFAIVARDDGGLESSPAIDAQIAVTPVNDAPTLTTLATPVSTTAEDTEVQLTFADLAAAGNENDIDGTVDAFVIKSVDSGTLRIGTSAATAAPWVAGTNDVVDATNDAYWTPDADANGTQNALTIVARDNDGLESSTGVDADIDVTPVNDIPTLTGFTGSVDSTAEDTEVELTFADFAAVGDENDVDGSVTAFVIKAVNSGTLLIGTDSATATAWVAGTNDVVDATKNAYWTPEENITNSLNELILAARDNDGAESITHVPVNVNVTRVNDAPTLTTLTNPVGTTLEDTEVRLTFADLSGAGDENDVDGTVEAFVVTAVNAGSLRIGTSAATATPWVAGTNNLVDGTANAYWTPDTDANGQQNAFAIAARDNNGLDSVTSVDAEVAVTPVNDAPTLTTLAGPADTTDEDTEVELTWGELTTVGDEIDVDGSVDGFVVTAVNSGSLRIGTSATTATPWVAGANDTVDTLSNAYWTPDANQHGLLDALSIVALDNGGLTSSIAVSTDVQVNPVNDTPVADDESFTVSRGGTATEADLDVGVSLLDGDTDVDLPGDSLSVVMTPVTPPLHGNLSLNANGSFTYTHDGTPNFSDSFEYEVIDSSGQTARATVTITIPPINLPPIQVIPHVLNVDENTDTTGGLSVGTLNTIDPDGLTDTFSYTVLPGGDGASFYIGGTANDELIIADGTTLNHEAQASYVVNVQVTDSALNTLQDTITVLVNDVDEPPITENDNYEVTNGEISVAPENGVLANDEYPDGNPVTLTLTQSPAFGTLSLNADGSFTYTPNENFFGTDSFVYQADDLGPSPPVTASVELEVAPVGDNNIPSTASGTSSTPSNSDSSDDDANEAVTGVPPVPSTNQSETPNKPSTRRKASSSGESISTTVATLDDFDTQTLAAARSRQLLGSSSRSYVSAFESPVQTFVESFSSTAYASAMFEGFDMLRGEMADEELYARALVGSSVAITTSISAGYVVWLLRSGLLFSSFVSSMPAWQMVDPLPVLGYLNDEDEETHDDDSLESILANNRRAIEE